MDRRHLAAEGEPQWSTASPMIAHLRAARDRCTKAARVARALQADEESINMVAEARDLHGRVKTLAALLKVENIVRARRRFYHDAGWQVRAN